MTAPTSGTFTDMDCGDVKKNRDECAEAKFKRNSSDFDRDDVECHKADGADVRRECRQRKRD